MYHQEEIEYCPDCGWNMYSVLWPGNNGMVIRKACDHCGYLGQPEVT